MLKCAFNICPTIMHRNVSVVCLCRQTISRMYTIFNTVCAMSYMNNIINFKTFEDYLRELERGQTDRQTECINIFQLYWKVLTNRMHKHFSTLLESVKNKFFL